MQEVIRRLGGFWADEGCLIAQPFNTEVGAGTMNPATVLRVLGPEPWRVAYVEPSVRPDDSRYGENPNRLQTHTQYQVILKPEPGNPQELLLNSLSAVGIDLAAHDVRFVEDNWAQPAIGAWGLGWEVWLDGLEITQFTYFQQVGGLNLDPVAVEITYGLERILMAIQGVSHFRDIEVADGVKYGEVFGQAEFEMSSYYLDRADVVTNRELYERYVAEATRMVEHGLPVPAHSYVLKSSHAFNVLDARGAMSTTERAKCFSTMRKLAREVSQLWVDRREQLGFPLLAASQEVTDEADRNEQVSEATEPPMSVPAGAAAADALLEIGVEELPHDVAYDTAASLTETISQGLDNTGLAHKGVSVETTPRRVAVRIAQVAAWEPDTVRMERGPRWESAFDGDGEPTKALQGFLRAKDATVDDVVRLDHDGTDVVAVERSIAGRDAVAVLGELFVEVVSGLRASRNMRWSDPELSFSRPIRWLVALWGDREIPVRVSGLVASRVTRLHRTAGVTAAEITSAEAYPAILADHGVTLSTGERRARIVAEGERLAAEAGGMVVDDVDLLDELAQLVEEPSPIMGTFDPSYLELPEAILTTVMRKHQRYLAVRGSEGDLLPVFLTTANGPCDPDVVRGGNEAVIRARFHDARFFFDADLERRPEEFHRELERLTFDDRVGSMLDRARRLAAVGERLAVAVDAAAKTRKVVAEAGAVAKFDLSTQMVTEFSGLAGVMAKEYALRSGSEMLVAEALLEMEQPRTSAGVTPSTLAGAILALADRFDLLVSLFSVGAKPTGSTDTLGLRRAAIGALRTMIDHPDLRNLTVNQGLEAAASVLRASDHEVDEASLQRVSAFVVDRFRQLLREQGRPPVMIDAVDLGALSPSQSVAVIDELGRLAADETFTAVVAMLDRILRILPEDAPAAEVMSGRLTGPAEADLAGLVSNLNDDGQVTLNSLRSQAADLVEPVERFFTDVMVMDPDLDLRHARLALLGTILQLAPGGVDWRVVHSAYGAQIG